MGISLESETWLDRQRKLGDTIPVKIKHQIVANTVVVLENGDVIVGQAIASDVNLQVGMKDENGQQAYEVVWRLKIGRPV